jgi:hypothetical protein
MDATPFEEIAPLRAEVLSVPDAVRQVMMITDRDSLTGAGALLRRIKGLRAAVEQLFGPHIKRACEAHRALLEDRRRLDAPLATAEDGLKRAIAAYTVADAQRRAREARQLTAIADEAHASRVWAEVEGLAATGQHNEAAALIAELVATPVPVVILEAAKIDGVSCRTIWRYAVVDERQVPREYLMVDQKKLGGVVRALKGATQIPGVRVWADQTVAATARSSGV